MGSLMVAIYLTSGNYPHDFTKSLNNFDFILITNYEARASSNLCTNRQALILLDPLLY